MNAQEAGVLLLMMSEIDNRELGASRAQALAFVLDDIPLDIARLALKPAYREAAMTNGYVDAGAIRRHSEPILRRVARDVRSAKARGWVAADWAETRPLPAVVSDRLRDEFTANNDKPEEIALLTPGVNLGQIGRRLPKDGDR